jgi:hypothetical protein
MEAGFRYYNIDYALTYDWNTIYNSPWSLLLVIGAALLRTDGQPHTPASWFNYNYSSPDHFIIYGPAFEGAGDICMNPLVADGVWLHTDVDSLRGAFGGGYVLYSPPLPTPEPVAPPALEQLAPARFRCIRPEGFGLKPERKTGGENVGFVPYEGEGNDTGQRWRDDVDPSKTWARLQFASGSDWADGFTFGNQRYFERLP